LKSAFQRMRPILESEQEFICNIQAPCFQSLLPEEVELVRASKTQVLFRKGDHLSKQGAFASYALFVINGLAVQYIEGEHSKNYNLRIIQPGEFVGLSAVFNKNTFNYSSVAITDCQVYLVEKAAIVTVVQQNGTFGFNLIKRYCEQNSNLFDNLRHLLFQQMNGRIASALLYIDGLKEVNPSVFQLLSRKDLADFAAISTESCVKLLKSFEKDGFIALLEKDIVVINHSGLTEISKKG
jgi:CRP-like cAMP-binding protein